MRTDKMKAPSISSDKVLHLHCPISWGELSEEQLRYVLALIGSNLYNEVEIRTLMLIRLTGITVLKKHAGGFWSCSVVLDGGKTHYFDLQTWQVQDMIGQLQFINRPEEMDVRLESIQGFRAVDKLLHFMKVKEDGKEKIKPFFFYDYLNLEVCYQGFLMTKRDDRIDAMARILYRDKDGNMPERLDLDVAERTGTLFWFFYIKKELSKAFPNFFRPASSMGGDYNVLDSINAQLRALTDGDVTKEETVKHIDCWRCLTELDAKAREAAEFKLKYGN